MIRSTRSIWSVLLLAGLLGMGGCANEPPALRTTGEYIDDHVLISRVRSALNANAEYKYPDVEVHAYRGTVQLGGFAVSESQKERAAEIARTVPGVFEVENRISIDATRARERR